MKKFITSILSITIIMALFSGMPAFTSNDIKVEFDGRDMSFDVNPQIIDGRAMVPLREIFEACGALVKWEKETQTVSARKGSKTVTLSVNSSELNIDKGNTDDDGNPITETVNLDVPAQIVSGRTLVPARAISEAFGLSVDWDEDNQIVNITTDDDEDDSWKENTGTINLSDLTFTGSGIEITNNQISITAGGDFTLTGVLTDGSVTVSTKEKVKLRLSDVSVTSSDGPCIFVEDADKAYITISEGTKNTLIAENSESGAIYAKDNLEIKGNGTLTVSSPVGHAIKASDNLTIESGNIYLTAFGDGIHINDTFKMTGGNVNISADGDGIDSESIVIISGGELNIETNGKPKAAASETQNTENTVMNNARGKMMENAADVEFEKSSKGINAEWMMCISGGEINVNSASHAIHCEDDIEITGGVFSLGSEYEKGISAHGNLTISNSDTVIDIIKSTEGLESKDVLTINDGTIKIVASDDGINATGGKSGEMMGGGQPFGMRNNLETNTGENTPADDISMGADAPMERENRINRQPKGNQNMAPPEMTENGISSPPDVSKEAMHRGSNRERPDGASVDMMPPAGGGTGGNMSDCLIVNGGNIEIFAKDDCLDSNGNLLLNGGIIKATKENGSFTGSNSVLDPDGKMSISAGVTLVAVGSGGTQGNLSIPQNTITLYSEQTHSEGESIKVKDESGNIIVEYAPGGSYSAVLISSPDLQIGKSYTVTLGTETQTVTLSSQNTSVGEQKNFFGNKQPFNDTNKRDASIG